MIVCAHSEQVHNWEKGRSADLQCEEADGLGTVVVFGVLPYVTSIFGKCISSPWCVARP